jgi:hypothetical protein
LSNPSAGKESTVAAATGKRSNKEIVSEVMTGVFVKRRPGSVLHYFSESYIQHNPRIPNGREAMPGLVAGLPQDFLYSRACWPKMEIS